MHIAPASNKLASHRTAGSYRNYGERLYVEGRLEAMKKEQLVGGVWFSTPGLNMLGASMGSMDTQQ